VIEPLSILFVYSLPAKRLKGVKRKMYQMLGSVQHKCSCCNEMQIDDKVVLDIIKKNIKLISIRQMEIGK
jgi:hypothetical protein